MWKKLVKKVEKNIKKETQNLVKVVDKELRNLDIKLDNPSHLTSSNPEKKEEAEVRFGLKEEKEQPVNEQPTPIETIVIESSNDKQEVINIQPIAVNQPKTIPELAEKYNVPFIYGKAQAGCPGIMNPIGETPEIELNWGFGWANADKTHRFEQFKAALELLENFGNDSFKEDYVKLSVFGRAMLVHIASVQGVISCDEILQTIAPYASEGLNLQEVPFGKNHGITVQKIFDQYVGDKTSIYLEEERDIELEQAIQESLKEDKVEEVKIIEQTPKSMEEFAKEILERFSEYDFKDQANQEFKALTFVLETAGVGIAKEVLVKNPLLRAAVKEIIKITPESNEKMQNLLDDVILILEKDLVKDIASGAVYKSHEKDKLNPVIARINEINKLKDSNQPEIELLNENRDHKTIDTDIFNFALKSEFCDGILKVVGLVQVGILVNSGHQLMGSEDLVNDYDSQFHPQKDLLGEDN